MGQLAIDAASPWLTIISDMVEYLLRRDQPVPVWMVSSPSPRARHQQGCTGPGNEKKSPTELRDIKLCKALLAMVAALDGTFPICAQDENTNTSIQPKSKTSAVSLLSPAWII